MKTRRGLIGIAVGVVAAALGCGCVGDGSGLCEGEAGMTLVYLETGPNSASHTAEQKQEIFRGHMSNMQRLADEGKLLVRGPSASRGIRRGGGYSCLTRRRWKRRPRWRGRTPG